MNQLQLIKSESFGEISTDIYSNGEEMFMTAAQLCECLGENRNTFDSRISRNPKLKTSEFSLSCKMQDRLGRFVDTRVFNEDGIYEITLLSESEKGDEFRSWVRKILKGLRKGEITLIESNRLKQMELQAKQDRAIAMRMNAENRRMKMLLDNPNWKDISPVALETMGIKVVESVTGTNLGNLLPQTEITYSATQVGEMFGVSSTKIGKLANAHGLKTDEFGITVMDKSRYSTKEVPNFRYNQHGVEVIGKLLNDNSKGGTR